MQAVHAFCSQVLLQSFLPFPPETNVSAFRLTVVLQSPAHVEEDLVPWPIKDRTCSVRSKGRILAPYLLSPITLCSEARGTLSSSAGSVRTRERLSAADAGSRPSVTYRVQKHCAEVGSNLQAARFVRELRRAPAHKLTGQFLWRVAGPFFLLLWPPYSFGESCVKSFVLFLPEIPKCSAMFSGTNASPTVPFADVWRHNLPATICEPQWRF